MNKPIYLTNAVQMILTIVLCFASISVVQGADPVDTCALLTRAEIQAAVGQNAAEGKLNPHANPATGAPCEYMIGAGGVFSILAKAVKPEETPDRVMAEFKKRKIPVSEAPGIGDRSFFSSPGYGMVQLNTFKGSSYLIITMLVPGASEALQKTAAENLMRKALAKL
ncbi:MAG: hypothetical protein KJ737_21920 [Proteobacteria bacterium]|nr:hypothetical protein [Pseudomonadota bacterium]